MNEPPQPPAPDVLQPLRESIPGVLQRLREATGSDNDAELARRLGISQTTISTWRKRGIVPYEACAKVAIEKGVSLDKLIFGEDRLVALDPELLRKCVDVVFAYHRIGPFDPKEFAEQLAHTYEHQYDRIYGLNKYSGNPVPRDKVFDGIDGTVDLLSHALKRDQKSD